MNPTDSKKKDDVRLRQKPTKTIAEMEIQIENYKRVIDKLRSENETLLKDVKTKEETHGKIENVKHLKQKIKDLEDELHAHELRDLDVTEKDKIIQKLKRANQMLQEKLETEVTRYEDTKRKYDVIVVKFTQLSKDYAKMEREYFSSHTGSNINNYDQYLASDADFMRKSK